MKQWENQEIQTKHGLSAMYVMLELMLVSNGVHAVTQDYLIQE